MGWGASDIDPAGKAVVMGHIFHRKEGGWKIGPVPPLFLSLLLALKCCIIMAETPEEVLKNAVGLSETAAKNSCRARGDSSHPGHLDLRGTGLCVRLGAGAYQHGACPAGSHRPGDLLSPKRCHRADTRLSHQPLWASETGTLAAGANTESEICHSGFGLRLNRLPVLFYFPIKKGYTKIIMKKHND